MSVAVRNLDPKSLWNHFADLNAVPRPSKKEERVIKFMQDFGTSLGLPVTTDEVGNVIIKKPATPGQENRPTIALQSHLDMVHQKNSETNFDFLNEGIEMDVDEDWVKAKGTTLGADNGIGVAAIMALLSSKDMVHPKLEALFTIDEETGMTGALGLKGGLLEASILLNLDTEEDTDITIGCAGGVDVTTTGSYEQVKIGNQYTGFSISLNGLQGGHSGMEIHKGLGNANKLINRLLWLLNKEIDMVIVDIDGGGLRNAIPRESMALVAINQKDISKAKSHVADIDNLLVKEYSITDPSLQIKLTPREIGGEGFSKEFQTAFLSALYACPVGIYRMSAEIEGLVQTSNNLARVKASDGNYSIMCLTRGSVDSEKWDQANAVAASFEGFKGKTKYTGAYPGWEPNPSSSIIKLMESVYTELFNTDATVNACHAGLECGILGSNYPEMQMVSFGPNIRGAHSPDEKVQISSVNKFWKYLLEILKRV